MLESLSVTAAKSNAHQAIREQAMPRLYRDVLWSDHSAALQATSQLSPNFAHTSGIRFSHQPPSYADLYELVFMCPASSLVWLTSPVKESPNDNDAQCYAPARPRPRNATTSPGV